MSTKNSPFDTQWGRSRPSQRDSSWPRPTGFCPCLRSDVWGSRCSTPQAQGPPASWSAGCWPGSKDTRRTLRGSLLSKIRPSNRVVLLRLDVGFRIVKFVLQRLILTNLVCRAVWVNFLSHWSYHWIKTLRHPIEAYRVALQCKNRHVFKIHWDPLLLDSAQVQVPLKWKALSICDVSDSCCDAP